MTFQNKELQPERSARDLYGYELREYRNRAGLSLAALAGILNFSKTHLGNIETADRAIPPGLSEKLDAAFGTDGNFARLYRLARKEQHPRKYRRFMELEGQAEIINQFAGHLIPGLIQTSGYARHSLTTGRPEEAPVAIEELLTGRLARQVRLRSESPPHFNVVLDEAVLRRPVGGPTVMRDQLRTLLAWMDTRCTMIQVMPFARGGHGLMGGSMTLLTLPDDARLAYLEGIRSGQVIEDSGEVAQLARMFDRMRSYALSPLESAAFITSVMEDYRRCDPQGPRQHRLSGARARTAARTAGSASR